ncbi:MAG: hypothetical protein ACR2MF_10470 [Chthoniobacterales bacterium]
MMRLTSYRLVIALVIGAAAFVPSVATAAKSRGHHKSGALKSHARSEATRHRATSRRKAAGRHDAELREIERRGDDEIEPPLPESE